MMLDLELRYQACNDEQCLLPETLTFEVPIEVVGIADTIQRVNEAVFANVEFGAPPSGGADEGSLARALSGGRFGSHSYLCLLGES